MPPATLVQRAAITFDLAKPTLTAEASAKLEALRPLLQRALRVRVTGFTDDLGPQGYNDALAHARARTALIRLRELIGENDAQLSASGRGLCCYVVANSSDANRAQNRRAELELTLPGDERTRRLITALAHHLGGSTWQADHPSASVLSRRGAVTSAGAAARPRSSGAVLVRYTPAAGAASQPSGAVRAAKP